jgi:hypothetical protein
MMTKPVQSRRFHFLTAERSGEMNRSGFAGGDFV